MKLQKSDYVDINILLEQGLISSPRDLYGDTKPSMLFNFLVKKFGYLLDGDLLDEKEIELRRKIHPIIEKIGPLFLDNHQVFENRRNLKNPYDDRPDNEIILPDEPVIWVPNHTFKDDVLASVLAAKRNAYVVFASLPEFFNTINGLTVWLNGAILTNRKSAKNRNYVVERCVDALNHGVDIILYPEGILNKTPNLLILPLWSGIYKVCKETGAKVVPIVHYLKDMGPKNLQHKMHPTDDDIIHTVVDDPIRLDNMTEEEALAYLRDVMATWKFLMMERYGYSTREEVTLGREDSLSVWEDRLKERVSTMDYYDSEIELSADYRAKKIVRPEDVWSPIADMEISIEKIPSNSMYAQKLVRERKREDTQRRY